jgi:actin-like ATPase involved in cell morphogenesis
MTYQVGIDLGTTFSSAAVCRNDQSQPDVIALGTHGATIPSVAFIAEEGSLVIGEAAERRAVTDPNRIVREFKRRIGDTTPLMVGGASLYAHQIAAGFIRQLVDQVAAREGGPAAEIAVTHPAAWGLHKQQLLISALSDEGLTNVRLVTEPTAAAVSYARQQRVEPGVPIAVYDLGGGTFDAAVVRKTEGRELGDAGFELLGRPEGIDRLGGADFDELVFDHVRNSVTELNTIDPTDPGVVSALARLRRECRDAKEALSADTEVMIPVMLPGVNTQVRLVRAEFEEMIGSGVSETVESLVRTVESADIELDRLAAVLLVGGSSRIPLVTQLVSARLNRPVTADADPKTSVAAGAALVCAGAGMQTGSAASQEVGAAEGSTSLGAAFPEVGRPNRPAIEFGDVGHRAGSRSRRVLGALVAASIVGAALFGGVKAGVIPLGVGDNSEQTSASEAGPSETGTGQTTLDAQAAGGAGVDSWTGAAPTETTKPGPTRPGARPAQDEPDPAVSDPARTKNNAKLPTPGPSGTQPTPSPSTPAPSTSAPTTPAPSPTTPAPTTDPPAPSTTPSSAPSTSAPITGPPATA